MELNKMCTNCHYFEPKSYRCWRHNRGVTNPCDICSSYRTCSEEDYADEVCKENLTLRRQLADKDISIRFLGKRNDKLNSENVKLGKEIREKESKIADLTQQVADKNQYKQRIEELETWIKALESDCKRYEEEKLDSRSVIAELGREVESLREELDRAMKVTSDYKRLSEIKDEKIEELHGMAQRSGRYPWGYCHAYAARLKAKYDSLIKVGFTEDQAMQFLPMWIDEEV